MATSNTSSIYSNAVSSPAISTDITQIVTEAHDESVNITSSIRSSLESVTDDITSTVRSSLVILPPLIFLIVFTFSSNIVVMVCTRIEQRLRKPTNMYVFSLAVADCMVSLFVMTSMVVYTLHGYWPLGQTACTVWIIMDFTCCTVSMLHLCLIAYDRYTAMTKPLKYKHPKRSHYIAILIGLAWVVSILAWVPAIIYFRTTEPQIELDCYFFPNKVYILVQSILVYFIPILILVYFYVMCLYGLHAQYIKVTAMDRNVHGRSTRSDSVQGQGPQSDSVEIEVGSTMYITDVSTIPYSNVIPSVSGSELGKGVNSLSLPSTDNRKQIAKHRQNKAEKRHQDHLRTIRTLGVIIIAFLVCWIPFCVFWPVSAFCESCISAPVYEYSYWSAYINSTVNPLLYFLCNKDFRKAFITLCQRMRLLRNHQE